jgi:PST family polysaccharide transporter
VISLVLGLLRMKVAAVLIGPVGIGLIGLLQSLVATAATLATGGLGQAGARQLAVASARDDQKSVAVARAALSSATVALALAGAVVVWLLRRPLAELTLNDPGAAEMVGWLAIAVALAVISSSQTAVMTGLRRVADVAKSNVAGAAIAAVLAIASVGILGERGILLFVLSAPIAAVLAGWWFLRKLHHAPNHASTAEMAVQWKMLARLGFAFMVLGLLANACQLYIRTKIQWDLGIDAVGQFQASWTLSMQYGSLILAGLSADFYPRLTATMERNEEPQGLVNDQVELTLLLGAPAFILIAGTAPWLVLVLFSSHFHEAAGILRWLVLGDVLRISITPLIYVLWASGRVRSILLIDGSTYLLMAVLTTLLLPVLGVRAAGVAYLGASCFYFLATIIGVGAVSGFRLRIRNAVHAGVVFGLCAGIAAVSSYSPAEALAAAFLAAVAAGAYGYRRLILLLSIGNGTSPIGQLLSKFRK